MKIKDWLQQGSESAKTVSPLDKELILCYNGLGIDRLQLILRAEETLAPEVEARVNADLAQRAAGEPLAYILGWREFYGRRFVVTPDVLIPRPETEELVTQALQIIDAQNAQTVLEVGTGSGAIAVTLQLERPKLSVVATDLSAAALVVAQQNAERLGAQVTFLKRDLLTGDLPCPPDLIVANLPYVDAGWDWLSPELQYEPASALFAEDAGLALIKQLLRQATARFPAATLVLESDPCQQAALRAFAAELGYTAQSVGFATCCQPAH